MNQELINKLQHEAKANQVASTIFYYFSLRKRTRETLSVKSLRDTLRKEGSVVSKDEICKVFLFMQELGLCVTIRNRVGNIKGIKDINCPLSDIGHAAIDELNPTPTPGLVTNGKHRTKLNLVLKGPGQPWTLELPGDYTDEDILRLINFLRKEQAS